MTDTDRLNWLETLSGIGLINDNGRWAISGDGVQNVPMTGEPTNIETVFFIGEVQWFDTVREAIDSAMK